MTHSQSQLFHFSFFQHVSFSIHQRHFQKIFQFIPKKYDIYIQDYIDQKVRIRKSSKCYKKWKKKCSDLQYGTRQSYILFL